MRQGSDIEGGALARETCGFPCDFQYDVGTMSAWFRPCTRAIHVVCSAMFSQRRQCMMIVAASPTIMLGAGSCMRLHILIISGNAS